jgi:hypothetical protein
MRSIAIASLMLIAVGMSRPVAGAEPDCRRWPWPWDALRQKCQCADDYKRKPMPGACPVRCLGDDDYCGKPLPGTCGVKCFGPDDYCRKPYPRLQACWPPPWFGCGCGSFAGKP